MKKTSIIAAASLLVALASSSSFAALNAGENEVSVFGSFNSSKPEGGKSSDTTTISAGMGHYFTDYFSFGGDLSLTGTSADRTESSTLTANINAKLYLNTKGTIIPFVGAQFGYLTTANTFDTTNSFGVLVSKDTTSTGINYGAMAGVKFFMSENASFDAKFNYSKSTITPSESPNDFKQTDTGVLVGLTYYFGR
jgi:opacity protein-like surface antigen